ncbi:MAG TPA: TIGR03087 family PEP-CTERM/XrtA system glycosyltransferase [Burkholderiaceae bacterium]
MANILYLVHRLPYPPNKGDKVRSFHLLKHLAARHSVYLATFVDDEDDWQHVEHLKTLCAEVHAVGLHPRRAKLASLRGLLSGEALSLPYYRSRSMQSWVRGVHQRVPLDASVVFSSTMAQYALPLQRVPMLVDFVDVDSAKWTDYAKAHAWPMSWLYEREGRKLLAFEQAAAERARCSFFVTENEVALFRRLSPQLSAPVEALCNGVNSEFFAPDAARASPFPPGQTPLVFTGAMDYWPNVDAVTWFAAGVLPLLRAEFPDLHFHIVGRSPTPAVQRLAGEGISVTGTVPDVRPYLQHAAAVVAPLRLARGIQNKILEAMAMARPVVAARSCVQGLSDDTQESSRAVLPADDVADYVQLIAGLLRDSERAACIGSAGRARVLESFSWDAHLAGIDRHLDALTEETK